MKFYEDAIPAALISLKNSQYSENCFARDDYTPSVFIIELPKFQST